jgi:hypothetical protein
MLQMTFSPFCGETWTVIHAIYNHTFSACTLHVQEGYWPGRDLGLGKQRICTPGRASTFSNTSHRIYISTPLELLNGVRWLAEGSLRK